MPDLTAVVPEIIMACAACALLMMELFVHRKDIIAAAGVIAAAAVMFSLQGSMGTAFNGMVVNDGYAIFFKVTFLVSLILSTMISVRFIEIVKSNFGEYYSLLLFSTLGMMVMASAGDLIVLYLGLELMALSTYVLAGFIRWQKRSNEAALKYFLLGAFASAILLYGISLSYGYTGTTDIRGIATYLAFHRGAESPMLLLGLGMLVSAFCFKVAAVPFHMWAPDVYEGAPTSITAFMSVGPKAAGFAVMGRVLMIAFASMKVEWAAILVPLCIATMAVGNVIALSQTNIKRMLAYSSIAHAGYALVGVVAATAEGMSAVLFYMMAYAFMNIGAFALVILLGRDGVKGESIYDFQGLSKTHPVSAALMLIFMFSLTGIPPTAGFMGKFYIFMAAVNAGYTPLVLVAVVFSAISAFFYLRIVMLMYMNEPKETVELAPSSGLSVAIGLATAGVLLIGILPSRLFDLAKAAVTGFGG